MPLVRGCTRGFTAGDLHLWEPVLGRIRATGYYRRSGFQSAGTQAGFHRNSPGYRNWKTEVALARTRRANGGSSRCYRSTLSWRLCSTAWLVNPRLSQGLPRGELMAKGPPSVATSRAFVIQVLPPT